MTAAATGGDADAAKEPALPAVDPALVAPLGGASPVGRDLSYEAHFERLGAEVERGASLAGELPDWRFVEAESARILREESKDFRAAAWLAAARATNDGWSGAAEGLAAFHAVEEAFWDGMFPPVKRARARAALAGWLWETMAKALAPRVLTAADRTALLQVEKLVPLIDASLAARLGDANPGAGPMRSLVRERVRSLPAPAAPVAAAPVVAPSAEAPPPSTASAGARSPRTASGASAAVPGDAAPPAEAPASASLDEAEEVASRWRGSLGTLARHARESSPSAPWPYRLARLAAWITIEAAPDVENGKTFIRPPRAADRTALEALAADGSWEALRDAAEDALSEHIFWLDLHRLTAMALDHLGPAYAAARATVGREVVALVARVPALLGLSFANATPFAAPETVDWIEQERARFGAASGGAASGSASSPSGTGDDGVSAILESARAIAASGTVEEAMASALTAALALPTARGRFRARLAVAQLAATRGQETVALALFEQLLPEVTPTLEAWEPGLCASLFESHLKALRSGSSDDDGARERQSLLFRRLLSLDPAAALRSGST